MPRCIGCYVGLRPLAKWVWLFLLLEGFEIGRNEVCLCNYITYQELGELSYNANALLRGRSVFHSRAWLSKTQYRQLSTLTSQQPKMYNSRWQESDLGGNWIIVAYFLQSSSQRVIQMIIPSNLCLVIVRGRLCIDWDWLWSVKEFIREVDR